MSRTYIGDINFRPQYGLLHHRIRIYLSQGADRNEADQYLDRIHQMLDESRQSQDIDHTNWDQLGSVEIEGIFNDNRWPRLQSSNRRSFRYIRIRMIPVQHPGYSTPHPNHHLWQRYIALREEDQREMNIGGMPDESVVAIRDHQPDTGPGQFDDIPASAVPGMLRNMLHGDAIERRRTGQDSEIHRFARERFGDNYLSTMVEEAERMLGGRHGTLGEQQGWQQSTQHRRNHQQQQQQSEREFWGGLGGDDENRPRPGHGSRGQVGPRRRGGRRGRGRGRSGSRGRDQANTQGQQQGQGTSRQQAQAYEQEEPGYDSGENPQDDSSRGQGDVVDEDEHNMMTQMQNLYVDQPQQSDTQQGGRGGGRGADTQGRGQGRQGRGGGSHFGFSFGKSKKK